MTLGSFQGGVARHECVYGVPGCAEPVTAPVCGCHCWNSQNFIGQPSASLLLHLHIVCLSVRRMETLMKGT